MKKETKFKKVVLADLKTLKNIWFFKSHEVCIRGILDVIICLNGFFIAIELKKDKKAKIDELQWFNLGQILCRGNGLALLAWPDIWPEVFEALKKIDGGKDPRRSKILRDPKNLLFRSFHGRTLNQDFVIF